MTENAPKKWMPWTGRVLTALPALAFFPSGIMKLTHAPQLVEMFVGKLGYPESTLLPIGVIELVCVVLYLIPQTAVLGAILLTGYLGGAIATHVRVGDPFVTPLILGVIVWAGLFFRDERLRALLPLRAARG